MVVGTAETFGASVVVVDELTVDADPSRVKAGSDVVDDRVRSSRGAVTGAWLATSVRTEV